MKDFTFPSVSTGLMKCSPSTVGIGKPTLV